METLSIGHFIPSVQANFPTRLQSAYITSENFAGDALFPRKVKKQNGYSHIISRSRKSVYQDFQEFVKPSNLLPATEVTTYPMHVSKEIFSSLELDQQKSFYILNLRTSRDFGSSLRDLNAAILLCLIDENGKSILQRISAVSLEHPRKEKDMIISEYIHFQRGSIDIVTFKGPKLEKIAALWIGLESVVELRPTLSTQIAKNEISTLSIINCSTETPYSDAGLSKEASMKEYGDLKFSLLFYDFILVVAGAMVLVTSSNEANVYSFLAGGISGFLYLLLLQRSVDGLSVPSSSTEDDEVENSLQSYGGLKGSVMSVAFVMSAIVITSKYLMGGTNMVFSPSELFVGVAGFLACKIAVVLAAFKPLQMSVKENKIE